MTMQVQTGGNVVALRARDTRGADCFVEVESYWRALCRGRPLPDRDEVDPRGIAGALDRVFLIERIAPGQAWFRLAGQHLDALTGIEMRGMPMTALVAPGARGVLADALAALFDGPARIDLTLEGQRSALRGRLRARMLLLPLRDRAGGVTRAIGCLSAGTARIRGPQRFDIADQSRQPLIGPANGPVDAPAAETADQARPEPATAPRPASATLRLVGSDS